jgi:hypothetical protein
LRLSLRLLLVRLLHGLRRKLGTRTAQYRIERRCTRNHLRWSCTCTAAQPCLHKLTRTSESAPASTGQWRGRALLLLLLLLLHHLLLPLLHKLRA